MVDLGGIQVIAFDADGTLRRSTVDAQPCPNAPEEWVLIPGVADAVACLRERYPALRFGIASNQGGIGLGFLSREVARQMLEDLAVAVFGHELAGDAIQICPHRPRDGCSCRKPEPTMLLRIATFYLVDVDRVLYVGDMES